MHGIWGSCSRLTWSALRLIPLTLTLQWLSHGSGQDQGFRLQQGYQRVANGTWSLVFLTSSTVWLWLLTGLKDKTQHFFSKVKPCLYIFVPITSMLSLPLESQLSYDQSTVCCVYLMRSPEVICWNDIWPLSGEGPIGSVLWEMHGLLIKIQVRCIHV